MKTNISGATLIKILISVGITLVAGALLLMLSAWLAMMSEDPGTLAVPLSLACLGVSAVVCGALSARLSGAEELAAVAASAVGGVLYILVILLLCIIPIKGEVGLTGAYRIPCLAVSLLLSVVGGFVFRPRRKRRPSVKRRVRRK